MPVPSREPGNTEFQDEPGEESIDSGAQMGEEGRHELDRPSQGTLAESLARDETQAVRCLRLVVWLVLMLTATLVSVGAYMYMKNDEEDTFQEQYFDLAYRLGRLNKLKCQQCVHVVFTIIDSCSCIQQIQWTDFMPTPN